MAEQNIPEVGSPTPMPQKKQDTLLVKDVKETPWKEIPYIALTIIPPLSVLVGSTLGLTIGAIGSMGTVSTVKRLLRHSLEYDLQCLERGAFASPLPNKKSLLAGELGDRLCGRYFEPSMGAFIPAGIIGGVATALYGLTQPEMRPYSLAWLATNAVSAIVELRQYISARKS